MLPSTQSEALLKTQSTSIRKLLHHFIAKSLAKKRFAIATKFRTTHQNIEQLRKYELEKVPAKRTEQ